MFCPLARLDFELVGHRGAASGFSAGCNALIKSLHGAGSERAVSWVCHPRCLAVNAGARQRIVAPDVGTLAHAAFCGGPAELAGDRDGRSGLVCLVAV